MFIRKLPWVYRADNAKLKIYVDTIRKKLKERLIKRIGQENEAELKRDILSYIIESNQWSDQLTIDDVIDDFFTFVAAGMKTTASAMAFFMFSVLKNPTVYDKLRVEVNSGDNSTV